MPKLTKEQLIEAGLTAEAAEVVVNLQSKPKEDRPVWFRAKMTQAQADEINAAFPEVNFTRPVWKVKVKDK